MLEDYVGRFEGKCAWECVHVGRLKWWTFLHVQQDKPQGEDAAHVCAADERFFGYASGVSDMILCGTTWRW